MKAKKENYWFMLRLLLLMNVVLITGIVLARTNIKTAMQPKSCNSAKASSCGNETKANLEVLNAISVKLM